MGCLVLTPHGDGDNSGGALRSLNAMSLPPPSLKSPSHVVVALIGLQRWTPGMTEGGVSGYEPRRC